MSVFRSIFLSKKAGFVKGHLRFMECVKINFRDTDITLWGVPNEIATPQIKSFGSWIFRYGHSP